MRHVLLGSGMVCLIVVAFWFAPVRTAPRQQITEIPQPPGWVAFDADVEMTVPNSLKLAGRFYRSSDGSERLETYEQGNPSIRVVSLKNIRCSLAYAYSPKVGWLSFPMVLPPDGWKPLRYREEMRGLSRRQDRIEGFDLYQSMTASGDIQFLAPALNFFPLLVQHAKDGKRWTYSHVQIRPQDEALFAPPAGVQVTARTKPAGIVWNTPGAIPEAGKASAAAMTPGPGCRAGSDLK